MASSRTAAEPYLPPGTRDVKLQYIHESRVLLCTQCGYCVLHRALDRHLKAIHHLPAAERKRHLAEVQDLDVADLEDVPYPDAGSEPIPGLPIFDGYSCGVEGCQYLCVTNKRMQAHWRSAHDGENGVHCHRVRLQTFFRGNSLRYFTVARRAASGSLHESDAAIWTGGWLLKKPEVGANKLAGTVHTLIEVPTTNTSVEKVMQSPKADMRNAVVPLKSDLPPPDNSIESAIEWFLTRQFCEESYFSLQPVKSAAPSWRDEILQACSEADFLRFAILSLSANYIAVSFPDSRQFYGEEAGRYRDLAITSLAKRISTVNADNFFAVFNFTRLITLCCLAGIQLNKLEGQSESYSTKSVLPEWFPIQHQGKALIWPYRGDGRIIRAMHGPWEPLATSNAMPEYDLSNNPYDERLEELELALKALPDGYTVDGSCLEALNVLRRVWATPYRDRGNGFRDVALMWATRISSNYLALVESHDPVALIILAHYWVLWSQSEEYYWYMKGHAETMLLRIVQRLEWKWQDWIEWPIFMILGADLTSGSL